MQTSIATKVSKYLDLHEYPSMFFQSPWLVRLVQNLNMVVTLRNWCFRRELKRVLSSLGKRFDLLDAGCGLGDFALLCAKRYPGSSVTGVDISDSNIRLAKTMAGRLRLGNTEFVQEDLARFRGKKQFDVVLCNAVLQSIQDDEQVLLNLADSLRTGGLLLLYSPVGYKRYFPFFAKLEEKYLDKFFYTYSESFSHYRYSANDVSMKIAAAGLNVVRSEFSHGMSGAIAFEIYSLFLIMFKKLPFPFLFVFVPLYAIFVFSLQLILMGIDYLTEHKDGNGLLVVARKN